MFLNRAETESADFNYWILIFPQPAAHQDLFLKISSIFLVFNLFSCIFYLVGRAKSHLCSINVVSVWCIFVFKWIWFIQNDLWDGGQFSTFRFNCSKGKNIFKDEIDWLVDLVSLILKHIILSIRNKNVSISSLSKNRINHERCKLRIVA